MAEQRQKERFTSAICYHSTRPRHRDTASDLARVYGNAITTRFSIYEHDPFELMMEQEYERALLPVPQSVNLRVEYAKVLLNGLTVQAQLPPNDPNVQRVAAQLAAALAIDPQNEGPRELLEELRGDVDGTLELPTAVALVASTSTATTPAATSTLPATIAPTRVPPPEPSASLPSTSTPQDQPTRVPAIATPTQAPADEIELPVLLLGAGTALVGLALVGVAATLLLRRRR